MSAGLVDLNQVRRAWTKRYGTSAARTMLNAAGIGIAMDSALAPARRAHDQDQPDERLEAVKTFLRNRLSPEDFDRLERMLGMMAGEEGPENEDEREAERARLFGEREGRDEPEPFRGEPRPGGKLDWRAEGKPSLLPRGNGGHDVRYAHDSRPNYYFTQFPGNLQVGFVYGR
jgi:hypothetical protein